MKIEVPVDKPTVCKIIQAATPLFAMKGVAGVSVKEVAEAAGVNVALISYYFGGKDNLYAFILENQLNVLDESLNDIERKEACPVAKIRMLAQTTAHIHTQNPYLDRLFYGEVINPTKCFERYVLAAADKLYVFVKSCIMEAQAQGKFRPDLQAEFAAIALLKILNQSLINLFIANARPNGTAIEEYTVQALDIYLHGVSISG